MPIATNQTDPAVTKLYTPAEYRQHEAISDLRHEFHQGAIVPMPGGSPNHNRLTGAIYAYLLKGLAGQPFDVFVADMRVWMPEVQKGAYPDVFVTPRPLLLNPDCKQEILNPAVIVEVLSPSTEDYDRGRKFLAYRSIPSFSDYVLVSQNEPMVTHYSKCTDADGQVSWRLRFYRGLSGVVHLSAIAMDLALRDLYDGIDWALSDE